MSKISRFKSKAVSVAKNAVGDRGEAAAPEGGGAFADYAVVSLHCLRIYLGKFYREALDLLSEMPHILAEIGLEAGDLPHHSTLVKAFDRLQMKIWRVLLRLSAKLHDTADHAAMDATFFNRGSRQQTLLSPDELPRSNAKNDRAPRYEKQAVLDVHCTTEKRQETQTGGQLARRNAGEIASLAADKVYDWIRLRE